jgi:hypothetical protein
LVAPIFSRAFKPRQFGCPDLLQSLQSLQEFSKLWMIKDNPVPCILADELTAIVGKLSTMQDWNHEKPANL